MSETTIEDLLRAAEPAGPRPLRDLLARLEAAGLLRGTRRSGSEVGTGALGRVAVAGLAHDSRQVRPGSLFVAVHGEHADGHDFVAAAARGGAVAALVERPVAADLDEVVVSDARRALATAAAWWYGDPSRELGVIGVTGTDGKTTTCFLAVAALEACGVSTGLIGTVETKIGRWREANPEHVTTPEAPELQAMLRAMANDGNRAAVVETTSHGLTLHRVDEISYDVAILTNLSHEHLELHGTFEAYRAAKLGLFERLARREARVAWPRTGIVNRDDASADLFEAVTREAGARLLTYGTAEDADVRALAIEEGPRRLRVDVAAPGWQGRLELRLAGRFNVHNALAVIALGRALDLDPAAVVTGLESVEAVPGRMERLDLGQPFGVVIDYAHSPASLETVLDILAPVAAARGGGVIVVFGSAGERDRAKRPMMGRVAGERARLVVVTDEDPRGEDRVAICDEIARGAEATGRRRGRDLLVIPDRPEAIRAALGRAMSGDVVLLAGKGHERTIIGPEGPRPWNEREEAQAALAELGYGAPSMGPGAK